MQIKQYVAIFTNNNYNILIYSRKLCILELMIKSSILMILGAIYYVDNGRFK